MRTWVRGSVIGCGSYGKEEVGIAALVIDLVLKFGETGKADDSVTEDLSASCIGPASWIWKCLHSPMSRWNGRCFLFSTHQRLS